MRAVFPCAASIDDQRVVGDLEALLRRNVALTFLDRFIDEFFNSSALGAHDMVMMMTTIKLEHCLATFKMMLFG